MAEIINYTPPPTIRQFIRDYRPGRLFYDWIVGPVGSGKTTGLFFKLCHMASLQAKSPDGIRRTRAVIVRNTMPQLKDTTLSSWSYWFKDKVAGDWLATQNKFILRFGDVECEVMFRALDTADDVARVLSLEVTFAILDEFVQIPKQIVDALSARLGRYPSARDGGATNWGMWGSSNPDTEDNWWYEYLHDPRINKRYKHFDDPDAQAAYDMTVNGQALMVGMDGVGPSGQASNSTYFLQPSGFAPDAENLENLPGGQDYYNNQAIGKSEAWVKQFLEAEWGYSAAGKPVVPTFKADYHIAKQPLMYNPRLPLIAGVDPGLDGSAFIFGQLDLSGRLNVLGERVQSGYGTDRLIRERVKPYVANRFPQGKLFLAPDPAAGNRAQNDEKTAVDIMRRYYEVPKLETNNRLPLRLNAIEYFTTRLLDTGAALQIDPVNCPHTIRALKGGWRYEMDPKKDMMRSPKPEKNNHSHSGDAFGYLCRYFHRQTEREMRYGGQNSFKPPRVTGSSYHFR